MSFLRLLSSATSPRSKSGTSVQPIPTGKPVRAEDLEISWHMPSFGCIFMTPPDDPLWPHALSDGPREDQLLEGELSITVPRGSGVFCKAIRLIFRTRCKLSMGPVRGWEEDEIFERRTEMIGGTNEGIYLNEGSQRHVSITG